MNKKGFVAPLVFWAVVALLGAGIGYKHHQSTIQKKADQQNQPEPHSIE